MEKNNQKIQRARWREIVDEQLASNMTQKAFCEKRNINLPQFIYYRSQFKREAKPQAIQAGFVPVNISQTDKAIASSEIKLSLPNGFQCAFSSSVDMLYVKRLVEALLSC